MFNDSVLCQFGKETQWEDRTESFHSLAYEEEEEREIKGNGTMYAVKWRCRGKTSVSVLEFLDRQIHCTFLCMLCEPG
jgi:hypothetical protein